MKKLAIFSAIVLVTAGAILAQAMLDLPASSLVLLG